MATVDKNTFHTRQENATVDRNAFHRISVGWKYFGYKATMVPTTSVKATTAAVTTTSDNNNETKSEHDNNQVIKNTIFSS